MRPAEEVRYGQGCQSRVTVLMTMLIRLLTAIRGPQRDEGSGSELEQSPSMRYSS